MKTDVEHGARRSYHRDVGRVTAPRSQPPAGFGGPRASAGAPVYLPTARPKRAISRRASGDQPLIGVNRFVEPAALLPVPIHKVDAAVEARQVARLHEVRRCRDGAKVAALLDRPEAEAKNPGANLMPVTIEAVNARATLGEIVARLRGVFGAYVEKPVF